MKLTFTKGLLCAVLMIIIGFTSTGQSAQPGYKDMISENPDAEADIKLVTDYVNTIVGGDIDKATGMLASNYEGYGPGGNDSSNVQQINESWKKGNAMQTNRKSTFVLFVVQSLPIFLKA